jgi:hypothetical protein
MSVLIRLFHAQACSEQAFEYLNSHDTQFKDVDPPALSHCIANGINATIDPPTPCAPRLLGATEWRLEPTGGLRQSP